MDIREVSCLGVPFAQIPGEHINITFGRLGNSSQHCWKQTTWLQLDTSATHNATSFYFPCFSSENNLHNCYFAFKTNLVNFSSPQRWTLPLTFSSPSFSPYSEVKVEDSVSVTVKFWRLLPLILAMNCTDLKLIRSPLFGCILLGPCPGPGSGRALFSVGGEVSRVCQQPAPGHLSPSHLLCHRRFCLVLWKMRSVFVYYHFREFFPHFWPEIYDFAHIIWSKWDFLCSLGGYEFPPAVHYCRRIATDIRDLVQLTGILQNTNSSWIKSLTEK